MPKYWRIGRFGYISGEEEPNFEKIKAKAKEILSKATKGNSWRCRCGTLHVPIVYNNNIVGELWEDINLSEVDIGAYWYGKWGRKIQLTHNGKVVGFIWLA